MYNRLLRNELGIIFRMIWRGVRCLNYKKISGYNSNDEIYKKIGFLISERLNEDYVTRKFLDVIYYLFKSTFKVKRKLFYSIPQLFNFHRKRCYLRPDFASQGVSTIPMWRKHLNILLLWERVRITPKPRRPPPSPPIAPTPQPNRKC